MNQPSPLFALGASTLVCAFFVVGCGGYTSDPPAPTSGTGGSGTGGTTGGGAGIGGSAAGVGGSGAGIGGAGMGGSAAGVGGAGAGGAGVGGAGGSVAGLGGTAGADAGAAGTAGSGAGAGGTAGGSEPTCDAAEPCGGSLVGTWTVGACMPMVTGEVDLESIGLPTVCTGAPITMGSVTVAGTLTFGADGSYMDDTTTTGVIVYEFPPECLELSGTTTDCPGIEGPLISKGFVMNDCVDNAGTGGCTCTGTIDQEGGFAFISYDYADSGTYEVMGNNLSMSSFGDDQEYSYCVSGSGATLGVQLLSVSYTGTVSAPIVLTK